jgi:hypothetical protein
VGIDGGDLVGDGHRTLVVRPRRRGAVAAVALEEQVEQRRRPLDPRAPARHEAGAAELGGVGAPERRLEDRTERRDEREELVVGVQAVGVDERARQVEHVEGDVAGQAVGPDGRHAGTERLDVGGHVVEEAPDGAGEGLGHGRPPAERPPVPVVAGRDGRDPRGRVVGEARHARSLPASRAGRAVTPAP